MLIDLKSIWPRPTTLGKNSAGVVRFLVRPPVPPPKVYTADDELVLQQTTAVDEDYWYAGLYTSDANRQLRLGSDEELSFLYIDEDYFTLPQFCQLVQNRQPVTDADENHAAPLGGLRVDEDYWVGNPYLAPTFKQPLVESEETHAAPLGGFRLDEDYWQQPSIVPLLGRPLVSIGDDELAPRGLEEYEWEQPRYIPFTANRQPVIESYEQLPVAPFCLDDEYWQRQQHQAYAVNQLAQRIIWNENDNIVAPTLGKNSAVPVD